MQLGLFDPEIMQPQGPSPENVGWVYVKADMTNIQIAKVGYTSGTIPDRLRETGNAFLVLHSAFLLGNQAKAIERSVFTRLPGQRIAHLATGWESEFLNLDAWAAEAAVARTLSERGMLPEQIEAITFRPNYIYQRVKALLDRQFYSDYWTRCYESQGAGWIRDVAEMLRPRDLPPRRR